MDAGTLTSGGPCGSAVRLLGTRLALAVQTASLGLLVSIGAAAQSPPTHSDRLLEELADPGSTHLFIAAHRGGWERDWENRAPENSLANIEKAVRMGFDVYETDIRRSADGVLVIMHDETVDRTTTGSGPVSELTLAELKRLNLRYSNGRVAEEPVPTLEEFLVRGKGRILFKADYQADVETLPQAVALLQEHGMLGHVILRLTWSEEVAEAIHGLVEAGMPYHPNLILFRVRNATEVRAAVSEFDPSTIEVDAEGGILGFARRVAKRLGLVGLEAWLYRRGMGAEATEALRVAREAGLLLVTRSGSGPSQWQRQIEDGFRMFHTEQPESMMTWLRDHGLHP